MRGALPAVWVGASVSRWRNRTGRVSGVRGHEEAVQLDADGFARGEAVSDLVRELERDGQYVIVRFCGDTGEEHEISTALIEYAKAAYNLREWSPGEGQHRLYLVRSEYDARLTNLLAALRGGK